MKKTLSMLAIGASLFAVSQESHAFFGKMFGNKSEEKIVLGFLPNEGSTQWSSYRDGMAAEIEAATGKEVDVRTTDSYEALIDAVLAGEIQVAFSGPNQYVVAKDDILGGDKIQPLVTNATERDLSQAGYPGYIATAKESALAKEIKSLGISDDLTPGGEAEAQRLELLQGKRFGFVSYASTSGFKVPRAILYNVFGPEGTNQVADNDDFANPQKIGFMDISVSATADHQGNMNSIYHEAVDAGAFCCDYFGNDGVDAQNLEDYYILAQRIVPNGPIWANTDALGSTVAKQVQDHFVNLTYENATEEGKGIWEGESTYLPNKEDGYVSVDDSFYQIVREL